MILEQDVGPRGSGSDQGSSSAEYTSSRGQYSSTSSSSSTKRRQWSCWCVARRPKMLPHPSPASASGARGGSASNESGVLAQGGLPSAVDPMMPPAPGSLIILELELEHDMYNPLYPPPTDPLSTGGDRPSPAIRRTASVGSGGSGSAGVAGAGGGSGSGGSAGRTSEGSDRTAIAESITPPAGKSAATSDSGAVTPGIKPTENTRDEVDGIVSPTAGRAQLRIGGPGDPGEEETSRGPTAEQILASTTSKAQPIRALERMRQAERRATQRRLASLKRGNGSRSAHGRWQPHPHHHHRSGRLAYAGSGSLDVFSVLDQVNEQLRVANDLQTLLDVVVGIIKDLTQFHRVLVYQFDELANGQVRSLLASLASQYCLAHNS